MLDVRGLRKVYAAKDRSVEALRDLTFRVDPGELVCIVGPSGCGKTTLLKCLAGLLDPTAGTVLVEGRPVAVPEPSFPEAVSGSTTFTPPSPSCAIASCSPPAARS